MNKLINSQKNQTSTSINLQLEPVFVVAVEITEELAMFLSDGEITQQNKEPIAHS